MSFSDIPLDNILIRRCLVMIFSHNKTESKKHDEVKDENNLTDENIPLFEDFIEENKGCFWDPHLEESLTNIFVAGIIYPNSVLISGRDIHLDTISKAWSKRVLRSPTHYVLLTVGELNGIQWKTIPQAQFSSLPDALCMLVSDLNKSGLAATFDAIVEGLKISHEGVYQPAEEVIYEALGTLIKERKLYHTGKGYHVITPDLFAHLNHLNGCVTLHGKKSALLMPFQAPPTAEMCSIACQTDKAEEKKTDDSEEQKTMAKGGLFRRGNSFKEKKSKSKKTPEKLTRSQSLRFSPEKATVLVEELNSKPELKPKERRSVLTRIFGSKNKKSKTPIYSNIIEDAAEQNETEEKTQKPELATFSGQFPPPDMEIYSDRILHMQPPQLYHRTKRSSHNTQSSPYAYHSTPRRPETADADTQSDISDWPVYSGMTRSLTMPEKIAGKANKSDTKTNTLPVDSMRDFVDTRRSRIKDRRSSSHSPDGFIHSHDCLGVIEGGKSVSTRGTNRQTSQSSPCEPPSPERTIHTSTRSKDKRPSTLPRNATDSLPRPDSSSRRSRTHSGSEPPTRTALSRPASSNRRSGNFANSSMTSEDIYESIHDRSSLATPHEVSSRAPSDSDRWISNQKPSRYSQLDQSPLHISLPQDLSGNDESFLFDSQGFPMFRHHFNEPYEERKKRLASIKAQLQSPPQPSNNNQQGSNNSAVKNSSQKSRIYRKYRELCGTPTPEDRSGSRRRSHRPSSARQHIAHAQSADSGVNYIGQEDDTAHSRRGGFNHIERGPHSALDLTRQSSVNSRPVLCPEPVKSNSKSTTSKRGYSTDERRRLGNFHIAEIHELPEDGCNKIEDSGFNSNRSANDANISRSAQHLMSNNGIIKSTNQAKDYKQFVQSGSYTISKSKYQSERVKEDHRAKSNGFSHSDSFAEYTGDSQLNGQVVGDSANLNNSSSYVPPRWHTRVSRRQFLEAEPSDMLARVPETRAMLFADRGGRIVNRSGTQNRPTSNCY